MSKHPIDGQFAGFSILGVASGIWGFIVGHIDSINSWLQTVNLLISLVIGLTALTGMLWKMKAGKSLTMREFFEKLREK